MMQEAAKKEIRLFFRALNASAKREWKIIVLTIVIFMVMLALTLSYIPQERIVTTGVCIDFYSEQGLATLYASTPCYMVLDNGNTYHISYEALHESTGLSYAELEACEGMTVTILYEKSPHWVTGAYNVWTLETENGYVISPEEMQKMHIPRMVFIIILSVVFVGICVTTTVFSLYDEHHMCEWRKYRKRLRKRKVRE